MSHVEYDQWANLIERVLAKYSRAENPSVFELGSGTGVLGSRLVQRGISYTGSDFCFEMCREARNRHLPVFCADARAFAVKKRFDLALFLYDGINYLQSADEYRSVMQNIAGLLNPGGLFLFDITTETNSLRHFNDYFDFEDYGDYCFVRRSYYRDRTMTQHNDFTIFKRRNGVPLYEKFVEKHEQKVFPVKYIAEAVGRAPFTIVGIWDGYSFKKYSAHSERIHFLLRKAGRT